MSSDRHGCPHRFPGSPQIADLEHSATEERWFSVGRSHSGSVLSVVYLWSEVETALIQIRIISARKATQTELRQYKGRI